MQKSKNFFVALSVSIGFMSIVYSGVFTENAYAIYDPSKSNTVPEGEIQIMSTTTTNTEIIPLDEEGLETPAIEENHDTMLINGEQVETKSLLRNGTPPVKENTQTEQPYNPEIAETTAVEPDTSKDTGSFENDTTYEETKQFGTIVWGGLALLFIVLASVVLQKGKRKRK